LVCGRFRACRAGMSAAQVSKQLASVREYGGLRLRDTAYESWEAMLVAVMRLLRAMAGSHSWQSLTVVGCSWQSLSSGQSHT